MTFVLNVSGLVLDVMHLSSNNSSSNKDLLASALLCKFIFPSLLENYFILSPLMFKSGSLLFSSDSICDADSSGKLSLLELDSV